MGSRPLNSRLGAAPVETQTYSSIRMGVLAAPATTSFDAPPASDAVPYRDIHASADPYRARDANSTGIADPYTSARARDANSTGRPKSIRDARANATNAHL
jgi:hypothetical protein